MPALALFMLAGLVASPALALPFIGGGGGKVTVTIAAAADCNNCGSGTASALKLRVFMVADEAAIRTVLNNKGLGWSKQLEAAGANVLGKPSEDFVAPGASKVLVIPKEPKATVIVVEGNFCKRSGAGWYFIQPVKSKTLKLTAGATGFTITTGK
jgi:predicted component of type VI protein secretion system